MSRDPDAPDQHWFEPVAEFLGPAYLRNAFTKGTEQEVAFLWDALRLHEGARLLDVGCGPGRHALAFARRGVEVTGIDISAPFVDLARQAAEEEALPATFLQADAREMTFDGEFDAVISLCQGAFGLPVADTDDETILTRMVAALRPDGRLAMTAFSAYFAVRFIEDGDTFDADAGVNHEVATVKGPDGTEAPFDLWTACYTPRELRLLARSEGLADVAVYGVAPGRYAESRPGIDVPEFLLVATGTAPPFV